jgi:hypothetical protein
VLFSKRLITDIERLITTISGYRQGVTEDIAFIESQNRGLQVQTANQQALLKELEQLLVSPDYCPSPPARARQLVC